MITRSLLVVALTASLAGCTASKQYAQVREQLDAYTIARPIAEVWPEALRFVSARGFDLVGADQKVLGDEPGNAWGSIFTKGHETYVSGKRWESETAMNHEYQRYRIVGIDRGSGCRIEYYPIASDDPTRNLNQGDVVTRDVELELAFVSTVDPEGAAKISRAAGERRN